VVAHRAADIRKGMTSPDPFHDLLGGLTERWAKAQDPTLDALALFRLTALEARCNLALLDLAVGTGEPLPPAALWEIPAVLRTDALQAVLGQGAIATLAFAPLRRLKVSDTAAGPDGADILTHLYMRIAALQGLASLRKRGDLKRVRIRSRLTEIRNDLLRVVTVLAREVRK